MAKVQITITHDTVEEYTDLVVSQEFEALPIMARLDIIADSLALLQDIEIDYTKNINKLNLEDLDAQHGK
jgi:Fe-S cluster assembly iron-binding protein IscA